MSQPPASPVAGDRVAAPFGAWASPFPISMLTQGVVGLTEARAGDGVRWWLEARPEEGGRQVLIRRDPDGTLARLTPPGFNCRDRVHEYGGAPYAVDGDLVVVSDFASGRLHRVVAPGELAPLTAERPWRYADLEVDRPRGRLLAVREDHDPETLARHGEAENSLVAVDLATGEVTTLVEGADFYAAPRLSPDGRHLAWLEWRHPNLPWDGTELKVAALDAEGRVVTARTVAGGPSDWISQPRWAPDGRLHWVAEPDAWMNLYRATAPGFPEGEPENLTPVPAEFAEPDWLFGNAGFGFAADGSVIAIGRAGGRHRLYRVTPGTLDLEEIEVPFTEMSSLRVDGSRVVFRGASPVETGAIWELDLATGNRTPLRRDTPAVPDPREVSAGHHVRFPSAGDSHAYGLYYAPHNPRFRAPEGELPPLIVTSHGGPTSAANSALTGLVQLWTSRGFAVLDVDYGGSTGYGRAYRRRLEGTWGVVDVDDCVAGAEFLVREGLVDPTRIAIRGRSAFGYTALCAITFRDVFRAGISHYGIGDLETFVSITHKFESRYMDRLVGPYPECRDRYLERSPIRFPDRIGCPVLILQGLDDRVVPPAQAEEIVAALRARGLPHAYLAFEGEDHGFRKATTIVRAAEVELSFLGQIFGFRPADRIEPIEIVNLEPRPATSRSRWTATPPPGLPAPRPPRVLPSRRQTLRGDR